MHQSVFQKVPVIVVGYYVYCFTKTISRYEKYHSSKVNGSFKWKLCVCIVFVCAKSNKNVKKNSKRKKKKEIFPVRFPTPDMCFRVLFLDS